MRATGMFSPAVAVLDDILAELRTLIDRMVCTNVRQRAIVLGNVAVSRVATDRETLRLRADWWLTADRV